MLPFMKVARVLYDFDERSTAGLEVMNKCMPPKAACFNKLKFCSEQVVSLAADGPVAAAVLTSQCE